MSSGDGPGPPSFSSLRTTNHRRNHQSRFNPTTTGSQIQPTTGDNHPDQLPSNSALGHTQLNSTNQIQSQSRTVNPRSLQSQPYGGYPPSLTDLRHGQQTFLHHQTGTHNNGEGDPPPSLTALTHQNRRVGESQLISSKPPSVNDIRRHGQQTCRSDPNLAYGCDDDKAPSLGDMTKAKVSETLVMGGGGYGGYGEPEAPSRDDIGRREREGSSLSGGQEDVDPQELVGLSMVRISESSIRGHMRRAKM